MLDGQPWPRITIVTPSFNQGAFVEATLRSVLLQGYPNLEYFVLDGGSTDGSVEVIRKYAPWLSYWVSEPDGGQSAAIDRGLRRGSGCSPRGSTATTCCVATRSSTHASRVGFNPKVVYAGHCRHIDAKDRLLKTHRGRVHSIEDLPAGPDGVARAPGNGAIMRPAEEVPLSPSAGAQCRRHQPRQSPHDGLLSSGADYFWRACASNTPTSRLASSGNTSRPRHADGWRRLSPSSPHAAHLLALAEDLRPARQEMLERLAAPPTVLAAHGRPPRLRLPRRVVVRFRTLSATLHRAARVGRPRHRRGRLFAA